MGLRSRKLSALQWVLGSDWDSPPGQPQPDQATFSVPRPTSSLILNALASSASSCATSSFSYQAGQAVTMYRHEVELAEHEDLRLERVEFEGLRCCSGPVEAGFR